MSGYKVVIQFCWKPDMMNLFMKGSLCIIMKQQTSYVMLCFTLGLVAETPPGLIYLYKLQ